MKDALKKLDKKFLIFACCLILIPIIIIIFLAIIQGCANNKVTYEKYEDKMISATEKYIKKSKNIPTAENEYLVVNLETLVSKGYIKSTEKLLDDSSCDGSVTVRRNGIVSEESEGYLNYVVNLTCDKHETNSLKALALKDLTTTESGLYAVNNSYIYKGEKVDNYLKFFGTLYRIISIDKNGIAKIIKSESESRHLYWDMKYNSQIDKSYGINLYKDSFILDKLNQYYKDDKKIKPSMKSKIVSYDVCADKRNIDNYNLDYNNNCSNVLKNQKITLINVADFANASLDKECKGINSKSCRNYNYMGRMALYSWTINAVANNTYEVYYIENGTARYQEANQYYSYNIVMYIDANEIVSSGNGTQEKPYVIE